MSCADVCLEKKKGKFWGEAGTGYLTVWRQWSRLLMNCCCWALILGSACVEICRGWAYWKSRVRCESSWGRSWATFHS